MSRPVSGPASRPALQADGLTRRYGTTTALDDVSLTLDRGRVHGLLGRNGAGKTTLLRLLTGADHPSGGTARLLGQDPWENGRLAGRWCLVREAATYPESFRVEQVLRAGALLFPGWNARRAAELVDAFSVPRRRKVKKLSRGMASALGIVVGLASGAEVVLFDEPYLGLDAVARQLFYDAMLAGASGGERTFVLSTHLIDEADHLFERVVVLDGGRVLLDAEADDLRGSAVEVTGPTPAVTALTGSHRVLRTTSLAGTTRALVLGLDDDARRRAVTRGLEISPVSLQQLVVGMTGDHPTNPALEGISA